MTPAPSTTTEPTALTEPWILDLPSESLEQTQQFGEILGAQLRGGDLILLQGTLGAGKTALTQGIARGLGIAGAVNSPTFTLLKEYDGRLPLYHFDLYRIENAGEVATLGFEQYFEGDGVSVVEWAERGEDADGTAAWPASHLRILLLANGDTSRLLRFAPYGPRGRELLEAFASVASKAA
jgi:tRNA threonylcarbamoyladenosine biosynthesis protein TsaE